jgi:hypothetical protein
MPTKPPKIAPPGRLVWVSACKIDPLNFGLLAACFGMRWAVGDALIVGTIGRIRREHLVKGKSIQEIARDLKVSWRQPSVP